MQIMPIQFDLERRAWAPPPRPPPPPFDLHRVTTKTSRHRLNTILDPSKNCLENRSLKVGRRVRIGFKHQILKSNHWNHDNEIKRGISEQCML